jgi:uncharacterized protein
MTMSENENRGLASADEETKREVARKGGEAVSEDREHMAEIGRKGGEASGGRGNQGGSNEQKAEAGRKGGEASRGGRNE